MSKSNTIGVGVQKGKKQFDKSKVEANLWRECCGVVEWKERDLTSRLSFPSTKLAASERRITELMGDLDLEQKRLAHVKKELLECQDYVIQQHDLGFPKL